MIILIDNYDSFTFNLHQLVESLGYPCRVIRNDELSIEEMKALNPSHLIISPGPGRPEEAGIIIEAIKHFGVSIPVLGICLGHQAIALAFGGRVILAPRAFHGKCSTLKHNGQGVFKDISPLARVARYHSLMVEETTLPQEFSVTSSTQDGVVMSLAHKTLPIFGLQFHPESFATTQGAQMMKNFFAEVAS